MSLTAAAITELTTESAPFQILNEWLRLWFDGGWHQVGRNVPVWFPKVNIAFGQSPAAQPMHNLEKGTDAEIRCVVFPRSELVNDADTSLYSGKLVTSMVLFNFWVSAKKPGNGQSEWLAEKIGQLLKAILSNPDTKYPLAEKGILSLQPKPPEPLRSGDYAKRLVAVVGQLQYPILFGDQPASFPPDDGEQSLAFQLEAPLLAGEYLMGAYVWNTRTMRLTGARWAAWPPAGTNVVLSLEVGGVLTGDELVIAPGIPNTDVGGAMVLDVALGITQIVRWKILAAPAPEDSAWHVTVTVQAVPA